MKDPFEHLSEATKHIVDAASVITVIGTLADVLPSIAALFTIVWTGIRIWETSTVRALTGRKGDSRAEQE